MNNYLPKKKGLYNPDFEHDACGVGFVSNVKGKKSHDIIVKGIKVLNRLKHRGAVGSDPNTGDGAGILIQIPHSFLLKECSRIGINLPDPGFYGTGLIFLPKDIKEKKTCKNIFEKVIKDEGLSLLGWRKVPVNKSAIGKGAQSTMPFISQIIIGRNKNLKKQIDFERKLYIVRKQVENKVAGLSIKSKSLFYITNISSKTFIYKGLLISNQLEDFFVDLKKKSVKSSLCLVHSRHSTNTFPSWNLAQPFRFLAHNGEINTLRGNINWMRAREKTLASNVFGTDIHKLKPVISAGGSDSAAIDNVFELLVLAGRSIEHAMMILIPAAWEHNKFMKRKLKDFYRYNACFMEPWDGPAAAAFTDGVSIAAVLDRNGLRPARYIITKDDLVVMASEVGVLDIKPENIKYSGRLEPGKMFLVNTNTGIIIDNYQIKNTASKKYPYRQWLRDNMINLSDISKAGVVSDRNTKDILKYFKLFGYTREDIKSIIIPMAEDGKEPIGSMGNDIPHAFLSKKTVLLYDYFKQLFAQVTNPAIDSIREKIVMTLESFIGPGKNILSDNPEHCRKLKVSNPILSDEELKNLKNINRNGFKSKVIYTLFDISDSRKGFVQALKRICLEAEDAVENGFSFLILSDKGTGKNMAALPSLLSLSAVHQYLVKKSIRSEISIIVESGEPREVHHFALLFGYGADCVNPYLVYNAVAYLIKNGEISLPFKKAFVNYRKAVTNGILKILSKMGICTLRSYKGSQIFEALGLDDNFIDEYFTGTVSRIGGLGINEIADDVIKRHKAAFSQKGVDDILPSGGIYQYKKDGEYHLWNPKTIAAIQDAARNNNYEKYKEFASIINNQLCNPTTLRSLFDFKKKKPISINKVESAESIMKRFATGAMSFGSISKAAHETIAVAMNRIGGKSNTGEGGEDPSRFIILPNGDSKRSAIKQVASGRFGVTLNYLVNADEIQIKIAQGAKPGEGGQLPGYKVNDIIARTRHTTPGVTLISPPPHHDIYSIEDLAQLIFDLKNANSKARISVKLVSETGVGTIAAGVAKCKADMILISGGDGGTGASPKSSIRYAGLPWELGLSEAHQTLLINNLRSRVCLQTDGQIRTGRDVAIAAILGAQEYGFCTAVLIVSGCVMLRHCHLNNCSAGIATQNSILQKNFKGRPEYIVNYFRFVAEELRQIMSQLGIKKLDQLIGRTDLLQLNKNNVCLKTKNIDYSQILYKPKTNNNISKKSGKIKDNRLDKILDKKLITMSIDSLKKSRPVNISLKIQNINRTVGTMLSSKIIKSIGNNVLLEDSLVCEFTGVAGQSFGAFLIKGITFKLRGLSNDYVGKGISGGKIIICPDKKTDYIPENNVIAGNTCFYGATSGEAYIRGIAGERFCVRNSGLYAVVEGVGDHGCEYMTGGRVIILGKTGINFAAGMSGGIAYVYDEDGTFKNKCNTDMVELENVCESDTDCIYHLLSNHFKYTFSSKAKKIIDNINKEFNNFVKVMPLDYKRVL